MDLKERRLSQRGAELMRQVIFDYILSNRAACVNSPPWEMHTTQGWTRHLYMIALVRGGEKYSRGDTLPTLKEIDVARYEILSFP